MSPSSGWDGGADSDIGRSGGTGGSDSDRVVRNAMVWDYRYVKKLCNNTLLLFCSPIFHYNRLSTTTRRRLCGVSQVPGFGVSDLGKLGIRGRVGS